VALASSIGATLVVGAALARADHPSSTAAARTAAAPTEPAASAPTPGSPTPASTSSGYIDGEYTGPAESTRWGDVQVQVTIQSGKIVAVDEVEAPSDGRSARINGNARPVLESEAVAAQSADIDAVSGATYTSETYKASLQAALDQATKSAATAPAG
jgi:uncharacterized protein with FMN-binding domain